MESDFLSYRSSRIHYCHWGTGPSLLFAFHGYGESAVSFDLLGQAMGPGYTLVVIDFPFHGKTEWKEGLSFEPAGLLAILEALVLQFPGRDLKWGIIGYSMGGRVALQLVATVPEKIDRLVLLAPDGLKMN